MKLYFAFGCAFALTALSGCSTESMKAYSDATTSRTVGMWEGEGTCITGTQGEVIKLRYDLKATPMPLTAHGITNVEYRAKNGKISGAFAEADAESAIGGNGTVIEKTILKRYGAPINWGLMTYTGKFIDDNTWEASQCGITILMKRVQAFSTN